MVSENKKTQNSQSGVDRVQEPPSELKVAVDENTGVSNTLEDIESTEPPNGGTLAWLQVLGSFCLWVATFGISLSFGVFETFYRENYLKDYSSSDIAWIGTTQTCLLFSIGGLSGPLFDRGHMRIVILVGAILLVVGLMTASVARRYHSIFLSLGVCVGLGQGCLFAPSMIIIGTYFTTRRPIASGLSAAGGGLASVVFTAIFRPLVQSVGFGWTLRIFAFVCLAFLTIAVTVLKQRVTPKKPRKLLDLTALKEADYMCFNAGMFLVFVGGYIPYYYMPAFAQEKIHTSEDLAYHMLPVIAAGSTIGRILPNFAMQRFGVFNVACFCILMCGMLQFSWGSINNVGGMATFSLFYGFFSGLLASVPAVAIAQLSPHVGLIGTRLGMGLQVGAVGFLIGNPIGGAILNGRSSFDGIQAFGGGCLLAAFVLTFLTAYYHKKRHTYT
ncbi:uncharacterized protein PV09_04109 [Verruconis gallopava]|uniref:Major facilitator superfamily (MFS) profile domain-containing protein n=1 Tax=Verruconis gallopava TaxID=253628 RepID=A0A0D2B0T8_9PEZI|nr:uncharacterized protein PV09_04109 [Verruconis gallopava]KIW04944.1 hypothetical protein PV09_04109 [Verruconis gallopava]